jgi:hypothetical protein
LTFATQTVLTDGPDHVRLSDIDPRFVRKACGKRGADVRPDSIGRGNPLRQCVIDDAPLASRCSPSHNPTVATFSS